MLSQVDHDVLLRLNSFIEYNELFANLFNSIGENPLIRGFPIFFPLVILWFSVDYHKRRSRIVIGLLATCLAVNISVRVQYHINIHTRPFLDQTLPIKLYDRSIAQNWDRLGSFPSDTATLYFSLVAIILLERPLWGSIALLWSLVAVGLVRGKKVILKPMKMITAARSAPR